MHFGTSIALFIMLLSITGSSIFSMGITSNSQSQIILPCKQKRKPREYDAFISQFDVQSKKPKLKRVKKTNIISQKCCYQKLHGCDTSKSAFEVNKQKMPESIDEHCKKTEVASALLAIRECTCHQKADDQSLPS